MKSWWCWFAYNGESMVPSKMTWLRLQTGCPSWFGIRNHPYSPSSPLSSWLGSLKPYVYCRVIRVSMQSGWSQRMPIYLGEYFCIFWGSFNTLLQNKICDNPTLVYKQSRAQRPSHNVALTLLIQMGTVCKIQPPQIQWCKRHTATNPRKCNRCDVAKGTLTPTPGNITGVIFQKAHWHQPPTNNGVMLQKAHQHHPLRFFLPQMGFIQFLPKKMGYIRGF